MKIALIFFYILIFQMSNCFAQLSDFEQQEFIKVEDSLLKIAPRVFFSKKESYRFESNKNLLSYWSSILQNEKSFSFPFDSLINKKYFCFNFS